MFLSAFPSLANPKLHNIHAIPKLVKKDIINHDWSKASGPDYIPVVVLKRCKAEHSYILNKLFNKCLKQSYFRKCPKILSVIPLFKNAEEKSMTRKYCFHLSVVSKLCEKLANNRLVYHLKKHGLLAVLQYGSWLINCRSFEVVTDRITRDFKMSGTILAVVLSISRL